MARKRGTLADWVAEAALPILILDRRHRVRVFNRGASTLTGIAPGDVLGRKCAFQGDSPLEGVESLLDACATATANFEGQPQSAEILVPTAGRGLTSRRAVLIPLEAEDEDGHLLLVLTNVGELVTEAAPILEAHARLRRAASRVAERYRLTCFVAESPRMQRVARQVMLAANASTSVWIGGPSGSGRTHVARTIHTASESSAASVAFLDGHVLSPSHLQAAIETALSNPNDTPATLVCESLDSWNSREQLLLAEKLAALNQPLRLIATGDAKGLDTLSADLRPLIGDIVIELPPLRLRDHDIGLLAQAFLEQSHGDESSDEASFRPIAFSESALQSLRSYSWPGEVRELRSVIEAAIQHCKTEVVEETDLPGFFRLGVDAESVVPLEPLRPLNDVLLDAERRHLESALQAVGGQKAKAAQLLGISRPKLYRRLEQLGIETGD